MKHGHARRNNKERLYYVWYGIKARCYQPKATGYENYGGRGIKMCQEWKDSYLSFRNWAYENGYDPNAPKNECTIERKDCNKDYEPDNCCWVNKIQQANNTRRNHFITYNGETKTLSQWAHEYKINPDTLWSRLNTYNLPIEKALAKEKLDETYLTYNGETHNLKEWAIITGINVQTLSSRIHKLNWGIEKALTTPTKRKNK